jgi:hypothetical protein
MSAIASVNPSTSRVAAIPMGATVPHFEKAPMRETLTVVRDTVVVLGLQVVFRTMMLLRKLNY